jgi:hypothetical protein
LQVTEDDVEQRAFDQSLAVAVPECTEKQKYVAFRDALVAQMSISGVTLA